MSRPHPCASYPRLLPDLEFLNEAPKHLWQTLPWKASKPIAMIDQSLSLTNVMTSHVIRQILETSVPSLVGKNEETVYDEDLRLSHEITHDRITLDKDFQAAIDPLVTQMATDL